MMNDYSQYLSPFTWRYGTAAMRHIWSEQEKRLLWRQIWVALAEVQSEYGLVTAGQLDDLRLHAHEIDVPRALEIEAEIQHDLMAELRLFASQCPSGGAILHLGATSMDIEDNADALRLRRSLDLILVSLHALLQQMAAAIEKYAHLPLMGFTHLQPAEPSTLGYRLALTAQDLLEDHTALRGVRSRLRGKGFKGAVGTSAAYAELLGAQNLAGFEARCAEKLDLPFFQVTSQVYPRRQDLEVLSTLASLGASLHKFAFDLRLLQSPALGELSEEFGEKQVGSSAMPFKRNPIRAEKINSLARYLAALPRIAWDNAALSLLERTLDDSANRRIILPEACLAADELLRTANSLVKGLRVEEAAMHRTLSTYAPFAATERLLVALVKAGADRQEMHERLRLHAMQAWSVLQAGEANPLAELICQDQALQKFVAEAEIRRLMDASAHLGDAPERALRLAAEIRLLAP